MADSKKPRSSSKKKPSKSSTSEWRWTGDDWTNLTPKQQNYELLMRGGSGKPGRPGSR